MLLKILNQEKFIYKSFIYDMSLESIVKIQYELAKKGISLNESLSIPIFEFEAFSGLLYKDLKDEAEHPRIE